MKKSFNIQQLLHYESKRHETKQVNNLPSWTDFDIDEL